MPSPSSGGSRTDSAAFAIDLPHHKDRADSDRRESSGWHSRPRYEGEQQAAASSSSQSRQRRAFGDDDDDDEAAPRRDRHRGDRQELSAYSRHNGAESSRSSSSSHPRPRSDRIIPLAGGSDWREDRKKRLAIGGDLATAQRTPKAAASQAPDAINDQEQKSGLQPRRPRTREEEELREMQRLEEEAAAANGTYGDVTPPMGSMKRLDTPPRDEGGGGGMDVDEDEDAAARRALYSGEGFGTSSSNANTSRTIPNEEDAFRQDTSTRPDVPTLADYAATPVEDFGKALLRGMGWKEGMGAGKGGKGPTTSAPVKKRSALLGLGAKERGAVAGSGDGQRTSSGASAKRQESRDRRPDARAYKPLVRREREDVVSSSNGTSASPKRRSRSPPGRTRDDRDSHDRRRVDRDVRGREQGERDRDRGRERDDRDRHSSRYDRDRDGGYHSRRDDRDREHSHRGSRDDERERRHRRDDTRDRDDRRGRDDRERRP